MKVKNIKSFIDFYRYMGISTCISSIPRSVKNEKQLKNSKKKELNINEKLFKNKKNSLEVLKKEIKSCECGLKDIATNFVFSDGKQDSNVMVIGEAPGAEEDKIGKPFVGQAGKLLDKMLSFIELDRKTNFYITNLVFWRPPGNRTPNRQEIEICLPFTKKHIEIIKPKLLILLGNVASQSILKTKEGINIIRDKDNFYEDEFSKMKIPVKATFHPAYLLRNPYEKKKMWDDLLKINAYISKNNLI